MNARVLLAVALVTASSLGPVGLGSPASLVAHGTRAMPAAASVAWPLAVPADADGMWKGAIELPGANLNVEVSLKDTASTPSGTITIPQQGAKDLPLADVSVKGDEVAFKIAGVPGDPSFKGTISADGGKITGSFTQAGGSFPFTITREAALAKAAQDSLADFQAWLDTTREAWKVPGCSIAIVKDGKVLATYASGLRDVENKKPVTPQTLFAIGSSTKAFTSMVLAQLVDEYKLEWDKPVINYAPTFRLYDKTVTQLITPRDLVTHRSGLPRHDLAWYNSSASRDELVKRLAHLKPSKDFRTDWQYNNFMFLSAGWMAEQITGKTWEENVRERIFTPLGMNSSNFSVKDSQQTPDYSLAYAERDDKVVAIPFRDISTMGPAGSINSSADDMAKWVIFHLSDGKHEGRALLQKATLDDLHTSRIALPGGGESGNKDVHAQAYALGWFTDVFRGHRRIHHGGNIDGFSALVSFLPEDNIGVVALTNLNGNPLGGLAVANIFERLLGLEQRDRSTESLREIAAVKAQVEQSKAAKNLTKRDNAPMLHPAAEYAGEYFDEGYGTITVSESNGELKLSYNNIPGPLEHVHFDTFTVGKDATDPVFEGTKISFITGLDGWVESIRTAVDPTTDEVYFKKLPDKKLNDPAYLAPFAGEYVLGPQVVKIELRDNALFASIPGAPEYGLVPKRPGSFSLKGLSGYDVVFKADETGKITQALFVQPNGTFPATRK
ncbi:MAG: serine hydrolase [Phycisphaerae bacterium]|nr:serine hydrolase [Phycisphaerae bacterium]